MATSQLMLGCFSAFLYDSHGRISADARTSTRCTGFHYYSQIAVSIFLHKQKINQNIECEKSQNPKSDDELAPAL